MQYFWKTQESNLLKHFYPQIQKNMFLSSFILSYIFRVSPSIELYSKKWNKKLITREISKSTEFYYTEVED